MPSEVFKENERCIYQYDFGDGWNHVITLEKVISDKKDTRIQLVDRAGIRPPEDIGGEFGFEEYLHIILDKKDPKYEVMTVWASAPKE